MTSSWRTKAWKFCIDLRGSWYLRALIYKIALPNDFKNKAGMYIWSALHSAWFWRMADKHLLLLRLFVIFVIFLICGAPFLLLSTMRFVTFLMICYFRYFCYICGAPLSCSLGDDLLLLQWFVISVILTIFVIILSSCRFVTFPMLSIFLLFVEPHFLLLSTKIC